MSRQRTRWIQRWRDRLAAEQCRWQARLNRAARRLAPAAGAMRQRWGYLSLVLVVVLTLAALDLGRENRNLRARVRPSPPTETAELPGALTERTPDLPPPPAAAVAAPEPAAVSEPAAVPVMALAARPEDLRWPVAGQLLHGFGWRWSATYADYRFHPGVAFRVPEGAEVRAALPGTVKTIARERLWNHRVELTHGDGLVTVYAHLGQVGVKAGQRVDAGQIMGRIGPPGEAGLADGIHLHFELRLAGEPVDPMTYLK